MDLFKEYSVIINEYRLLCAIVDKDYEEALNLLSKCKFTFTEQKINKLIMNLNFKLNNDVIARELHNH